MFSGFYTIASGLLTRQREQDTIGNNMVNEQTPGFRSDRLSITSFDQELMTRMEKGNSGVLGSGIGSTATVVDLVSSLMHAGKLKQTGRYQDLAIAGYGFFNIAGEDGTTYMTRNGAFDVDAEGYLSLSGIGRVMGTNGPIRTNTDNFNVDEFGAVFDLAGQQLGQLRISWPPEDAEVNKLENGMYAMANGVQAPVSEDFSIYQACLELSNVNVNHEMTLMIESQRAFQACSSAFKTVDDLDRKAATQIASI